MSDALTTADLREIAQVVALGGAEAERVGQSVDHRDRGIAVAALLDPGEVFDADAGPGGEVQSPQPR